MSDQTSNGLSIVRFEQSHIPPKRTKDVAWAEELARVVELMEEHISAHQGDIRALQTLRQNVREAPLSMPGIETLVNYYRQVDFISRRLAMSQITLNAEFTWYDSFDTGNSVRQTSMAFEKANILFNVAAIYTQLGNAEDAARNMQAAASILFYIAENFLHPPLVDIMRPSLLYFSALMLAQAQESITIKATQSGKTKTTLVKLALSTLSHYREALERIESVEATEIRSLLLQNNSSERGRDLVAYSQVKVRLWDFISSYLSAEVHYEKEKIGVAIALVQHSAEIGDEALKLFSAFQNAEFYKWLKSNQIRARTRLEAFQKENGLIYNQSVPSLSDVPELEETSLVKVAPLAEIFKNIPERALLFRSLVPLRIHEEISKYSEEKSKLLRYETMKANTADTELQTTLTSRGFPGALESIRNSCKEETLPEDIADLRNRILIKSGKEELQSQISTIVHEINRILGEVDHILDEEITSHQRGKIKYADCWTQSASHAGNVGLYTRLGRLQTKVSDIIQRNSELVTRAATTDAEISLLADTSDAILSHIPRIGQEKQRCLMETIRVTESKLQVLEQLTKDRTGLLDALRGAIMADDISDNLALSKCQDPTEVFHRELAKFDEICKSLEENIQEHSSALGEFRTLWTQTIEQANHKEITSAKKAFFERCKAATSIYLECVDSWGALINEAKALLRESQKLQAATKEFSDARAKERLIIERSLQLERAAEDQKLLIEKLRGRNESFLPLGVQNPNSQPEESKQQDIVSPEARSVPPPARMTEELPPPLEPSLLD